MSESSNQFPPPVPPSEYKALHDYGEPTDVGQQRIFDTLVATIKTRDANHDLDLAQSLPPLREAIDLYLQVPISEEEKGVRLEWIMKEFKLYGESFTFKPHEVQVFRRFVKDVLATYSTGLIE